MSDRPLHVCHIAYTFYDRDNRVMRYVQTLAARGDQVDVISLRAYGQRWRETVNGVSLYRVQRRATTEKRPWTYLLKIAWFWLKSMMLTTGLQLRGRYDLVHVHNIPDFLVFVAWLPKLMGARLILDIHDLVPELYAGKFNRSLSAAVIRVLIVLERACASFADHVIVSNHLWHDRLTSRSVAASKCTTIVNYPDLDLFKPCPAEKTRTDSRFVILYPGSLNHHQGVDIAVRAFASVRDGMPDAVFHIYGNGPALGGLIGLARELGLDGRVAFMERTSVARIAEVMAAAGVGIVPKRSDGFGNEAFSTKILEFMACAVPVIVSRTRIDDFYFNDALVNFFEPGSVSSCADVLLRTYRHRADQRAKVVAAREFAMRYSWQVRSADYVSLVDSLVTRAAPSEA